MKRCKTCRQKLSVALSDESSDTTTVQNIGFVVERTSEINSGLEVELNLEYLCKRVRFVVSTVTNEGPVNTDEMTLRVKGSGILDIIFNYK